MSGPSGTRRVAGVTGLPGMRRLTRLTGLTSVRHLTGLTGVRRLTGVTRLPDPRCLAGVARLPGPRHLTGVTRLTDPRRLAGVTRPAGARWLCGRRRRRYRSGGPVGVRGWVRVVCGRGPADGRSVPRLVGRRQRRTHCVLHPVPLRLVLSGLGPPEGVPRPVPREATVRGPRGRTALDLCAPARPVGGLAAGGRWALTAGAGPRSATERYRPQPSFGERAGAVRSARRARRIGRKGRRGTYCPTSP